MSQAFESWPTELMTYCIQFEDIEDLPDKINEELGGRLARLYTCTRREFETACSTVINSLDVDAVVLDEARQYFERVKQELLSLPVLALRVQPSKIEESTTTIKVTIMLVNPEYEHYSGAGKYKACIHLLDAHRTSDKASGITHKCLHLLTRSRCSQKPMFFSIKRIDFTQLCNQRCIMTYTIPNIPLIEEDDTLEVHGEEVYLDASKSLY